MKNMFRCMLTMGIIPFITFSNHAEVNSVHKPDASMVVKNGSNEEKNCPISLILSGGITYSMLYWTTQSEGSLNRNAFSIKPAFNVRLLRRIDKFSLEPFVGYSVFGGKSKKEENNYKDEYWFYSLEYGSLFMYKLSFLDIGIGLKGNSHIKTIGKYFGGLEGENNNAEWETENWTEEFPRASLDLGLSAHYSYKRFLIGAEIWGTLTDLLYGSVFDGAGSSARKASFLLFAGFII